MTRLAAALLLGAVLGASAVWMIGNRPTDPHGALPPAESSATSSAQQGDREMELERVSAELELEREMHRHMAAEVDHLRAALADALDESGNDTASVGVAQSPGREPGASSSKSNAEPIPPWFSAQKLSALGLDEREVERIRGIWDRYEMALIEIQHRRAREGETINKGRLAHDRLAIELRAQQELGDDGYDALLYATDRDNRVILADVLQSSPAAAAGLQSGDEVIAFDGVRIFRPRDLLRLTATGEKGEWVEISVLRDGVLEREHVQRGPLGVRLSTDKRVPYID
jgi:hypothetical protein